MHAIRARGHCPCTVRRGGPARTPGPCFAVLAISVGGTAGAAQIQQIGYGIAAGVLMDTFFVRSLLVPSMVVLLGRWNWWPTSLGSGVPVSSAALGTSTPEPTEG